jgi:hypothetical protein
VQQSRVESLHRQAVSLKGLEHLLVTIYQLGFVQPVPVDRNRSGFCRQSAQLCEAFTVPDDET